MTSITKVNATDLAPGNISAVNRQTRQYEDISNTNFVNGWTTDIPYSFATTAITQMAQNQTIVFDEGMVLMFTDGQTGFGNNTTTTLLNLTGTATCRWEMDNASIIFTNNTQNGFGQAGLENNVSYTDRVTGFIRNCRFEGVNLTLVFVNLDRAPLIEFTGNSFVNTVFNTSSYGICYYGLSFDGTLRGTSRRYTILENGAGNSTAGSILWNMHSGITMAGTDYATVATTDGVGNAHIEYQNVESSAFLNFYVAYLNNFRVEAPLIAIQFLESDIQLSLFAHISYSWSPIFNDIITGNRVTDVRVHDVPTDTVTPGTINRAIQMSPAVDGPLEQSGYLRFVLDLHTSTQTLNVTPRVLDFAGNIESAFAYNLFFKSFSHVVAESKPAVVNQPAEVQPVNGTNLAYIDQDVTMAQADIEVGDYTASTAPVTAANLGDLYPTAKRNWLTNTISAAPLFQQADGVMEFTANARIGPDDPTQTTRFTTIIRTLAAPTLGEGVTELRISGTSGTPAAGTITNMTLPSGIRINGIDPNGTWSLAGTTGGAMHLSGNVSGLSIVDNTFNGVVMDAASRLGLVPTAANLTVVLESVWGPLTAGEGVILDSTLAVTIASNVLIAANAVAGTNVTLIPGAAIPATTTFRVPATFPTGHAVLKLVGSAAGTNVTDVVHTQGGETILATIPTDLVNVAAYKLYYKPDNVLGVNGIAYTTSVTTVQNDSSVSINIIPVVSPILNSLVINALLVNLTPYGAVLSAVGTNTTATITISGAQSAVSNIVSLAILLSVTNDADYLNLLANLEAEADLITADIFNSTRVNGVILTLTAATQQIMSSITNSQDTGTLVANLVIGGQTLLSIIILPPGAGITIDDVTLAMRDATVDVRNALGWEIAEGDDELIGLAPNTAYVPGTDYTGNL